jgi:hypothetical protein
VASDTESPPPAGPLPLPAPTAQDAPARLALLRWAKTAWNAPRSCRRASWLLATGHSRPEVAQEALGQGQSRWRSATATSTASDRGAAGGADGRSSPLAAGPLPRWVLPSSSRIRKSYAQRWPKTPRNGRSRGRGRRYPPTTIPGKGGGKSPWAGRWQGWASFCPGAGGSASTLRLRQAGSPDHGGKQGGQVDKGDVEASSVQKKQCQPRKSRASQDTNPARITALASLSRRSRKGLALRAGTNSNRRTKRRAAKKGPSRTLLILLRVSRWLLIFTIAHILPNGGLPASPGLLALVPPSPSMNRDKIGGLLSPPHYLSTPWRPPSPTSPCGVYAVIPGDPPQLYAGRPPLQVLPGPFPARRGNFREGEDLHLQWRGCPGGPLPLDAEPLWDPSPK